MAGQEFDEEGNFVPEESKSLITNAPGKSIFSGRTYENPVALPTGEKPMIRKPMPPVAVLPQIPKNNLTLEEKVDYLERMMLMQSKQITAILLALTED